jgi:lipopolysaccharide/colanic/teichoic acid biosynthesis glycosyltransferase
MTPSATIQQTAQASALRAFAEPREPAPATPPATARRRSKERVRIGLYAALLLVDALAIAAGFLLGNLVRFLDPLAPTGLNFILLLLPLYAVLSFTTRNYSIEVLQNVQLSVFRSLMGFLLAVAALLLVLFSIKASADLSRTVFVVGIPAAACALCAARFAMGNWLGHSHDWTFVSEVLIIDGVAVQPRRGQIVLFSQLSGLSPVANDPANFSRIGGLLANCDRVLLACRSDARVAWAQALKGVGVPVEVLTPELDNLGALGFRRIGGHSAVLVAPGSLGFRDRTLKRALDLGVALSILVLAGPVMLLTAAAVALTSPGPVIFRQPRLGQGNRVFQVLKFRTMRAERADHSGSRSASRDDDRTTPVGRFLRRTSLDELPQLLNVIRGEMSVVGPRPHALGSTAGEFLFWHIDERYWQRAAVKPGITGLAQIRGFRGATLRQEDLTGRLQADLEYLSSWSLWQDLVIIIKTVKVLVHPNAY